MVHDFIQKYYYSSKSDANVCIPTTTVGATRGRAGQRKGTLSKEERDVINARWRATYKKKKEEQGYQEQKDKLNTQRQAAYEMKTPNDTNTLDIINAKRRATYKEKKEQINTQRRETDQKHRDSLTPEQKGEMSAQRRQREKAMRNTPCAESIAMPRPDLATSAAASTCGHTFKTYGISRMCTPHLLFVCIKQIFTCSVSV